MASSTDRLSRESPREGRGRRGRPAAPGHRVRRRLQGWWMRRPRRLPEDASTAAQPGGGSRPCPGLCKRSRSTRAGRAPYSPGRAQRRPLPKQRRRQQRGNGVASAPGVPPARSYLSYPYAVVALAIDPRDPDNIYAGSQTGGILKSADGGTTWAVANTGLTNRRVSALIIDPRKPRVLFTSTEGGVFRSTNGGARLASVQSRPAGRRCRGVCDQPRRRDGVRRDQRRRRRRARSTFRR